MQRRALGDNQSSYQAWAYLIEITKALIQREAASLEQPSQAQQL
jgi:hypothetical protein